MHGMVLSEHKRIVLKQVALDGRSGILKLESCQSMSSMRCVVSSCVAFALRHVTLQWMPQNVTVIELHEAFVRWVKAFDDP